MPRICGAFGLALSTPAKSAPPLPIGSWAEARLQAISSAALASALKYFAIGIPLMMVMMRYRPAA
jgi:hypothetical protein